MIRPILVAVASSFSLALAQDPVGEMPTGPLANIQILDVDKLAAQLPQTRVGRLAADEEVAEAIELAASRMAAELRRRKAVRTAAAELDVELEPWQIANMFTQPDLWRIFEHPLSELRSAEFHASLAPMDGQNTFPRTMTTMLMSCLPRYQGRWEQNFEREAADVRRGKWFKEVKDAKIDGFPAYLFAPIDQEEEEDEFFVIEPIGLWMQRLPGRFAYGTGKPGDMTKVPDVERSQSGQLSMMMDLQQYAAMVANFGGMGGQNEFTAIGLDKLSKLIWRGTFAGELILDELILELTDEKPSGLIGALLNGKAAPPAQGLPKGALAQLRVSIDLETVFEFLDAMQNEIPIPKPTSDLLRKALNGGISLGVCAPAPGGLIPRIYVSLDISDREALDELLTMQQEMFEQMGLPVKKVQFGDVECTTLRIPDAPNGIQPAYCIVGKTLHLAESGRSMRSFLKAQKEGVVAMDVGDAPIPEGPGTRLETLDLRVDEVAIYRAFIKIWLPLYSLAQGGRGQLLARDEMPSVDVIEEHLGTSRGVLYRDGKRFLLRHLGPLGGPEAAAIAMTFGPILSEAMSDYTTQQLSSEIAKFKLEAISEHFDKFREREKRWPKDLGELILAEKMPADLLLMPADTFVEDVALADGKTIKSSFRYFPEGIEVDLFNGDTEVVLAEIRTYTWGRGFLAKDGTLPEAYGDASSTPIDRLGK